MPRRFASLPLVVGHGAEHTAQDFLDLLKRYPVIAKSVEASVLVAERRWNLHLKSGVEVLLPEREPEHALRMLVDLDADQETAGARHRRGRSAAGRSRHGAAVRCRRRAREEALKAADKDKKRRGRGMSLPHAICHPGAGRGKECTRTAAICSGRTNARAPE